MNHLIRKAMLIAVGALLVAGAANAGAPSSANSTRTSGGMQLVGTNGSGGPGPDAVDTKGNFSFTIRDAVPNVIPGATVLINFTGCPHIRLCSDMKLSNATVDCIAKTVSTVTNGIGVASFSIVGMVDQTTYVANQNFPEPDPVPGLYAGCATVTVTVPGFPPAIYPNLIAAAFDHEVLAAPGNGVLGGDIAKAVSDVLSANYRERSDYSGAAGPDGQLLGGDVALSVSVVLGSGSTSSCATSSGNIGTQCP
jgi:hypothetical protein